MIMLVAAAVLLLAGCGGGPPVPLDIPETAGAGDIIGWEAVTHESRGVAYDADNGFIVVPENRDRLDSRLIALPVTRIRATGEVRQNPLFFLAGGPGLTNNGFTRLEWFIEDRDIVFVGYRGVDGTVLLNCPEVSDHFRNLPGDLLGKDSMQAMAQAYARAAQRMTAEGIDLDGYTALESVDDLESVRSALGYASIDLYGHSYGTRLALIYSWRYPQRVGRSALVGVNPPGRMFYPDGATTDRILHRYDELYAGDPDNEAAAGDLVNAISQGLEGMPERWLGIPLNEGMIRTASFESLGTTEAAAKVFDVWLAAGRGDYSGVALLSLIGPGMFANSLVWGDNLAKAASADVPVDGRTVTVTPSLIGSPRTELSAAASGWPVKALPEEYRRVRESSTPTLFLSGELDLFTPPEYTDDELMPFMSNAVHVVAQGYGHMEMLWRDPQGSQRLLKGFLDSGRVDGGSMTSGTWTYKPGIGFGTIAKVMVGAGALVLILVGVGVYRIVKRLRKGRR